VALEINSIVSPGQTGEVAAEGGARSQSEPPAGEAGIAANVTGTADAPALEITAETDPAAGANSPPAPTPPLEALLTEISATVRDVADLSRRYHARAEQREGVIDLLRSELEVLRRGERRGLLRPVLADLCRLRGDLLSQAAALPEDFDAAKAADLLRSYAETIELTLDSNGVVTYAPDEGERFDPRVHRRVGGEATGNPALAGHVAAIRRDGYLDIEANSPIAPAEVTVFAAAKAREGDQ
jgi:molecular chaperone GrpE